MRKRIADRRLRDRVPLEVELFEVTKRGVAPARSTNISESGICYSGSAFAPRVDGEEVVLRFRLPGEAKLIELLGAVADERCLASTSETFVMFVWPGDEDVRRIRDYIDFVSR
jgi:hypothetical protein